MMVLIFLGVWFLLSRVDYLGSRTAQSIGKETEEKLAGLFLKQLDFQYNKVRDQELLSVIDEIHQRLCEANGIDPESIRIHVYHSPTVNAFVIPDRNVIFFTGLLKYAENAEEFTGVLAHEIAHIEKNHVMKRLVKELGLGFLLTMAGMDGTSEAIRNALRILGSAAYDREQEREADSYGVTYLANADIDPVHFSNIMMRLASEHGSVTQIMQWMSTHPDSRERAAEILRLREEMEFEAIPLYDGNWAELVGAD